MQIFKEGEKFLIDTKVYLITKGIKEEDVDAFIEDAELHLIEGEKEGKTVSDIFGDSPKEYAEELAKEMEKDKGGSIKSILGMIGKFIAPAFAPLGFGDWRVCVALLTGFVAKETIVSSLSILFTDISIALPKIFSPLSAYCYMVFIALYVPCIATIYAIKRETSWKLAIFSIIFQFSVAWIVSFIIFQVGKLFL